MLRAVIDWMRSEDAYTEPDDSGWYLVHSNLPKRLVDGKEGVGAMMAKDGPEGRIYRALRPDEMALEQLTRIL